MLEVLRQQHRAVLRGGGGGKKNKKRAQTQNGTEDKEIVKGLGLSSRVEPEASLLIVRTLDQPLED